MISREMTGFLIHQVVSTFGVVMLSAMSSYSTVELLKLIRINLTTQATISVLLGLFGFPFQVAAAVFQPCWFSGKSAMDRLPDGAGTGR
jgi:hypothetical protein